VPEAKIAVEGLWVGEALEEPQVLSIKSFLANGHRYVLWAYNNFENIPSGTDVRDAREIIPQEIYDRWFGPGIPQQRHTKQTFANYFRYELKFKNGGWWVDLDCVCLKPLDFDENYVFSSIDAPRRQELVSYPCPIINGAFKSPPQAPYLQEILDEIRTEAQNGQYPSLFGIWGPVLMTKKVFKYQLEKYKTEMNVFCPHSFHIAEQLYTDPNLCIPDWAYMVHLYNYTGFPHGNYAKGSVYDRLRKKYL